ANNTTTRAFTVTVTPVNDPPTLNAINNVTINEDAPQQTVSLSGISTGAPNEPDTLSTKASRGETAIVPKAVAMLPNSTGALTFTPVANKFGTVTLSVTINDNQPSNNIVTRNFTVTVSPVNDPPTLDGINNLTINEDAPQQTVSLTGISTGAPNEADTL